MSEGVETTSILSEAGKPSTVMAYQCARRWWGKGRRVHTSSCRMTALSDMQSDFSKVLTGR
jgi:hypothetical protein